MKKLATLEACCAPLLAAPLDDDGAAELALAFKALADPVRLRLLSLIATVTAAGRRFLDSTGPTYQLESRWWWPDPGRGATP